MAAAPYNPTGEYQPESTIGLPALYAWPPRPLAALKYLFFDMLFPLEHIIYFSVFILFWFVPVHPVIIVLLSLFMAIGPVPSHSGFNFLEIRGKRFVTGDWFHQLHHQYFNFNFGNAGAPVDKLFGSWHDGSRDSLQVQKERLLKQRRQTA